MPYLLHRVDGGAVASTNSRHNQHFKSSRHPAKGALGVDLQPERPTRFRALLSLIILAFRPSFRSFARLLRLVRLLDFFDCLFGG